MNTELFKQRVKPLKKHFDIKSIKGGYQTYAYNCNNDYSFIDWFFKREKQFPNFYIGYINGETYCIYREVYYER